MRRLGIIACLVVPSRAGAQLVPVGVPSGAVRLELDGSLETFERRFLNGERQSYAADLDSPALGADRIPALVDADTRIGRITGNAGYRINLGALGAEALADVGTGFLGLSLGLTNQITIFGRIPLVRTRVQPTPALNPSAADGGVNPGEEAQAPFFDDFDAALAILGNKIAAGDYDGNPTQKALAQSTLADATALRADLFGLLADPATAAPFLPALGSAAGTAIDARIAALQNTLEGSLSVPGFATSPALPAAPVTEAELLETLNGPLALRLGESKVTFRGDAEAGASLTLIDRWDRGAHRGGFRAALSGLVRFPTGRVDRTDHPLEIGTGDGQTDLQVDLVTDIGSGVIGARLNGTYVRQLPSNLLLRVTSPSQPLAGPDRLALVRRDPGDILAIGVRPFFRLARTLALEAGAEHWTRGTDAASYASDAGALAGVDPALLAQDSKANATVLSLGITYSNPGGQRSGGTGLPVDASWSYERVLRAGGGRVPDSHRVTGRFRMYFGIW